MIKVSIPVRHPRLLDGTPLPQLHFDGISLGNAEFEFDFTTIGHPASSNKWFGSTAVDPRILRALGFGGKAF
jgi:hypothetical protein